MDALRLLSRSTNIKSQKITSASPFIPSEGQDSANASLSRKRKRVAGDDGQPLDDDSIRALQAEYKIRIVNLRKLHRTSTNKTRKQQKESARVFPQPLTHFAQLSLRYNVCKPIEKNLADQGYYTPTEIQTAALPLLLDDLEAGPDVLSVAPTGSGKTLAFLVPAIEKARRLHTGSERGDRGPSTIILAPTRELVEQVANEGRKLSLGTGVSVITMKRGLRLTESADELETSASDSEGLESKSSATQTKADVVVATPLSIANALRSSTLPEVTSIVLDEADVLLDPLFREQTIAVWSACTSPDLRVSLWSATIGSNIEEQAMATIAEKRKALGIKVKPPLFRIVIGIKDSSLPSITHKLVYAATEPGKLLGLRQLLHPSRSIQASTKSTTSQPSQLRPPFIIFTQTIERATALHTELQYDIPAAAGGSSRIAVLHSSLSSSARSTIMAKFRKGEIWILITTDLLSRGVDFRGVNGVVNYDIPTTSAAYVHRAGRTGRAGRSGGTCVTFYSKEDIKYLKAIASVIKVSQANKPTGVSEDGTEQGPAIEGIDAWILASLPDLSRKDRKELKERGVQTRRAIKESDDAEERKLKRKARIGTKSGYEKQIENQKRGAVEGSKRRLKAGVAGDEDSDDAEGFEGFD
jgi:ATP-dependent RNA helicase DDX52/ROK1